MLPILMVVLAGAPVHVITIEGEAPSVVLPKLADPQFQQVNGSKVRAYLNRSRDLIDAQLFSQFNAGPIDGWPEQLNDAWKKSLEHCRSIVGPAPLKQVDVPNAMACGGRISEYLWQRWLADAGATLVTEVRVLDLKEEFIAIGYTYEPGGTTELELIERGAPKTKGATLERFFEGLKKKAGTPKPRELMAELEPKTQFDPWAREAPFTGPLQLTKSCAALPKKLTFTTSGPLERSLAARWAPADATGPAMECTVAFSERKDDLGGTFGGANSFTVVMSALRCGDVKVGTERATIAANSMEALSTKLAQSLSARMCR